MNIGFAARVGVAHTEINGVSGQKRVPLPYLYSGGISMSNGIGAVVSALARNRNNGGGGGGTTGDTGTGTSADTSTTDTSGD